MKQYYKLSQIALLVIGIVLIAVGFFVLGDGFEAVSGVCIGVGAALIAMGAVNLVIARYYKKYPELKKQQEIEQRDERILTIRYKAKAKAFDVLIQILIVVPFLMILAGLPLWTILSVIGIYLFAFLFQAYLTIRYSKEM